MTSIRIAKSILKKGMLFSLLLGTVAVSLVLHGIVTRSSPFLSISSPRSIYKVDLTGQKERPAFFTNEVRFHVSKNGKPFLASTYLHSGDSFDLSFELGYPNHRWLAENVLQFYREEYFSNGEPDTLIISNRTNEVVKYLKVESVDKFLLFDLSPGDEIKILNSIPRGGDKGISLEGEFSSGRIINQYGARLPRNKEIGTFTYRINITAGGPVIESSR